MEHELRRPMELVGDLGQHVVMLRDINGVAEVAAEQHRTDREPADEDRRNRKQDQRQRDDPRALMRRAAMAVVVVCGVLCMSIVAVRVVVRAVMSEAVMACGLRLVMAVVMRVAVGREPLRTVERHEHQSEAVEGRHEHAEEHAPVGIRVAPGRRGMHGFDQGILREEAGEAREADQRQRADQ